MATAVRTAPLVRGVVMAGGRWAPTSAGLEVSSLSNNVSGALRAVRVPLLATRVSGLLVDSVLAPLLAVGRVIRRRCRFPVPGAEAEGAPRQPLQHPGAQRRRATRYGGTLSLPPSPPLSRQLRTALSRPFVPERTNDKQYKKTWQRPFFDHFIIRNRQYKSILVELG